MGRNTTIGGMGESTKPTSCGIGWGGRIRTFDLLIQSQAPYRLATPHCAGGFYQTTLQPPLCGHRSGDR